MLQQTTVAAVIPRFERFLARWPTVEALASAGDDEVLHEWAGLGYYARARNLIACARTVAGRGGFPTSEQELRELPGVGSYTAAAIAAIAFDQPASVVDTNVERVVARLEGIARPVGEARPEIRRVAEALTPTERSGDHAQAMMDLGATICRPRQPLCETCPVRGDCAAFASGTPEAFPAAKPRKPRPHRHGIAWWIRSGDDVWLVRRLAQGLLGGMPALPGPDWGEALPEAKPLATVGHAFTHFTLDLHLYESATPQGEGWWHPVDDLAGAGLPTLFRRAAEAALAAEHRLAA